MVLTGSVWPVHLPPQPDELLTSWIFRLARANAQTPHTFLRLTTGSGEYIKNDLDVYCRPDILDALAFKAGKKRAQLNSLTFIDDIDKLYLINKKSKHIKWVIPISVRKQKAVRRGIQYCPKCLCKMKAPYFKKIWRLAFVTCCPEHSIMLHGGCPACNSPIHLRKCSEITLTHGTNEPAFCLTCGYDLRESKIKKAPQDLLQFTNFNSSFLAKGFGEIGNTPISYSHLYFEGFRVLLSTIMYRRCGEELSQLVAKEIALQPFARNYPQTLHPEVELFNVKDRANGIRILAWLFKDWPHRFIQTVKQTSLQASLLQSTRDRKPYWLSSVVQNHLLTPRYSPSREEVGSALTYLYKLNIKPTRELLFATLGCGVSRFRPKW